MSKRFTAATDIIGRLGAHDGAPARSFAWRKAWLVRRDLISRGIVSPASPLRHIPGLRYPRLLGMGASALQHGTIEVATAADAVQVGEDGTRLRSFMSAERATLKIVKADTHYGPGTRREVKWRATFAPPRILIPQLLAHDERDGYLYVREELVVGRGLNLRRDRDLLVAGVMEPLTAFYEAYGIAHIPLSEAIAPLAPFLQERRASQPASLMKKLDENPLVAVSLCHNDMLPSNFAVAQKGVYFLDWGQSAVSLCGRDFIKLAFEHLSPGKIRHAADINVRYLHRGALSLEDMIAIEDGFYALKDFRRDGRLETGIGDALPLDRSRRDTIVCEPALT